MFFFWRALTISHSYTRGTEIQQIQPILMYGEKLKKNLKKVPRVRYLIVTQQQAKTHELSLVSSMRWTAFAATDYYSWTRFTRLIWISESFTYCFANLLRVSADKCLKLLKPKTLLNSREMLRSTPRTPLTQNEWHLLYLLAHPNCP